MTKTLIATHADTALCFFYRALLTESTTYYLNSDQTFHSTLSISRSSVRIKFSNTFVK